ncbi:MAG: DUF4124 domain-containing protein [Betaproteobacteria bacterium]|nr:DUF4124 domain-containing protein [Betaproteobacteria bacterium]
MRLLAALCLAAALDAHAELYKCVDEQGKTRYTDKPAADCKQSAITGSPPISGTPVERHEDLSAQERDFQRRQRQQQASEKKDQQALEQRCTRLRQERTLLGDGRRIVKIDAKGERVYMDDAARDQRLAQLDSELRGCP